MIDNDHNLSVSTYVEEEESREINIQKLNVEIKNIGGEGSMVRQVKGKEKGV